MDPLFQILKRLTDHQVEYVLVGGMAAVVHGSSVVTRDVDVCAPLDLANLERIVRALQGLNPRFRFRPDKMPLFDEPARLVGFRNINLITEWGVIDILGEVSGLGAYHKLVPRSQAIDLAGFKCRLLDLDALIIAKRSAGREKDLIGLRHLEVIKKHRDQNPGLFDDTR
jgi:predicted nucleotidyltransferase